MSREEKRVSLKNVNFNTLVEEKEKLIVLQKLQLKRKSAKEAKGEMESREKPRAKNKRRTGWRE